MPLPGLKKCADLKIGDTVSACSVHKHDPLQGLRLTCREQSECLSGLQGKMRSSQGAGNEDKLSMIHSKLVKYLCVDIIRAASRK